MSDPEDHVDTESETASSQEEAERLQEKIKAAHVAGPAEAKEAEDFKDKYFRLLADLENTRKRLQKEKQDMTRFAVENVIAEFLSPLDNLENALKYTDQMSPETKNWALGFQMILSQFKDVLHNHGVVTFHSEGTDFNPHLHEAVEVEETYDYPSGSIIKEFVRGYKCGDRTIRPARVKVAKTPSKDKDDSDDANREETQD